MGSSRQSSPWLLAVGFNPLSPLLIMLSVSLRAEYHLAQVKEKHAQLHKALEEEKTMEKQFGKYKKPQGTEPNDLFG